MPKKTNRPIDRRHFISGVGCGCMALSVLDQMLVPGAAEAEDRKSRGNTNPFLTPIAYCGIYCGACSAIHDTVRNHKSNGCLGCKSKMLGEHCSKCKVRACAESRQIENCGLCTEYPCDKIKEYHNDETEINNKKMAVARKNSEDFKYLGSDPEWPDRQLERWTCKKCKAVFEYESEECPNCHAKIPTGALEAGIYAKRKTPTFVEWGSQRWQNNLAYKTETKTLAGKNTISILGNERTMVFLPDAKFRDGIIECDISVKTSGGLAFRTSEDGSDAELVQLRFVNTKQDHNKKLLLYSCHKFWHTGWRELRKEYPGKYDAESKLTKDRWFHLKLVVKGQKLNVFIDKAEEPVLTVEKMLGKREEGGIGLYGEEARFANFVVS